MQYLAFFAIQLRTLLWCDSLRCRLRAKESVEGGSLALTSESSPSLP